MLNIYICTKFPTFSSNHSLFIAIKAKAEYKFHAVMFLNFYKIDTSTKVAYFRKIYYDT
jgi:hypothetical protein